MVRMRLAGRRWHFKFQIAGDGRIRWFPSGGAVETNASVFLEICVGKIDPVVNLQCEYAAPSAIIHSEPRAFVLQFAVVANDSIKLTRDAVLLDNFDKHILSIEDILDRKSIVC